MIFSGRQLSHVFFLTVFAAFQLSGLKSYSQKLSIKGRIVGTVKNERNELLPSATISIEGRPQNIVKTNVSGDFEIDIEPGTYTILISFTGQETKRITDVIVKKGEVTRQDVVLELSKSSQGPEVVVTASARKETVGSLLRTIKNNIAVSDGISIEQIKRTPDVNIAQSLKRINGVTIVDNKFVVVRGMGDRYNNVTINGSQLPSTEPNKKNFSFDLLPSNLIDNILVNKTATPDLPADFAGGLVQITTRDIPDRNMLSITVGTGYNSISTGKDFLSTQRADREYAGWAPANADWFNKTWDPLTYYQLRASSKNVASQINAMNSRIPNNWGLYNYTAMPTQDYQISGGLRKRISDRSSFGMLLAGSYRNEQLIEDYERQGAPGDSNQGRKFIFQTSLGGLFSLAYTRKANKFSFKNLVTRRYSHDTFVFSGVDAQSNPQRNYASYLTANTLFQSRLEGEHVFSETGLRAKWFLDGSSVDRDQPDNRFMKYFREGTPVYKIELGRPNEIGFGSIYSAELNEKRYGGGGDLIYNIKLFERSHRIKGGFLTSRRTADFAAVFLRPTAGVGLPPASLFGLPDYEAFDTENFRKGLLFYNSLTTAKNNAADTYEGNQDLTAAYLMLDLELIEKLRLIGGLRNENYLIKTKLVTQRDSLGKVSSDTTYSLKDNGLFPSLNLVYSLTPNSNVRFAFSKTVSRFDFREFANIKYIDFTIPSEIYGNPRLRQPYIFNYDLRYELYPTHSESISLSLYYKKFVDPIEYLIDGPNASQIYNIFTLNQNGSTNKGIELDFRKSFAFVKKKSAFFQNLYLSGNISVLQSDVDIDRNEIFQVIGGTNTTYDTTKQDVRKRPLQGLSPYAVNLGLLYQGKTIGFNIAYNRFGRRLIFAGADNFQDIYENPRDVIDAQLFLRILKSKMEIKFNVSDILNQSFIQYNGSSFGNTNSDSPNGDPKGDAFNKELDFVLFKAKRGVNISVSINYRF